MRYYVYGLVSGSKYLGEVEADSEDEARDKAEHLDTAHVSLCHQCADEVDNAEITDIEVEEIKEQTK
jgi:hypothetical protein